MFRKERRGLRAAVLAAVLAVPLGAAEAAGGTAGREPMGLWSRLAGWLWEQAGSVTVFWAADEGPKIDPDGQPQPSATQGDLGPYIDPDG